MKSKICIWWYGTKISVMELVKRNCTGKLEPNYDHKHCSDCGGKVVRKESK